MGNHEFPCDVCGENKFGLSGCDERFHSESDLTNAINRWENRAKESKQRNYAKKCKAVSAELQEIKKYKFGNKK